MRQMIIILVAAGLLLLLLRRRADQPETVLVADSVLDKQPAVISPTVTYLGVTSPVMPTELPASPVTGIPGASPVFIPGVHWYGAPVIKPPFIELPKGKPIPPEVLAPFKYKHLEKVETSIMQVPDRILAGGPFIS